MKSYLGPFVAVLLVVLFVLMMDFLWIYIDEIVGKGLGLGVILEFIFWGICTILPLALPLATLLSAMMTLGSLAENNELMAIRSAGIPLTRVLASLSGILIAITISSYIIGDSLVPKAYNEIYTLRDDIGKTKNEIKIPSGIFYDGIDGYILRISKQDKKTGMLYGVMVYDHSQHQGNNSISLADSALMKLSKNKDYLTFSMYHGASYQEKNTFAYRDTTLDLTKLTFDKQEMVIPLTNYSFQKSDSVRFDDQVKSMKASQLKPMYDSLKIVMAERIHSNANDFGRSRVFTLSPQLDTAVHRGATTLYSNEKFMQWDDIDEAIGAHQRAVNNVGDLKDEINSFAFQNFEASYYKVHSNVEWLKRFAQALGCFLLFFIGASLGALIGKGGLGTSAIVAALFFVLYYIVDITGLKLADGAAIPAWLGVFISAAVIGPIAFFLTWKATHDSKVVNMEAVKNNWRKIKSKVRGIFHPTRIVFMGTPDFAVGPLDMLVQNNYKIVAVVTVADKPSGRGLKVNESAVKQYAVEHKIPVLQPVKLKDPEFLKQLKKLRADLFVVVAFRMLPKEVWSMPKMGTFNLHAALLPQYRGAAPINWAIINGERRTGVTTFMLDENIDTGGILLRYEYIISPTDTAGTVHDKLRKFGSHLVRQTVEGLIEHNLEPRHQSNFIQGDEVLHPAPKLTPEICRIDWNKPTRSIYNFIRGLSPYPAAWTEIISEDGTEPVQMKIFFGEESDIKAAPGQIVSDGKSYLAIGTADGAILVKDLQLAGKKRMEVKAFLAGWREPQSHKAI